MSVKYKNKNLVSTADMAKQIGLATKTLLAHRTDYPEGEYWVNISPKAARPTYRWKVKAMLKKFGL